MEYVKDFEKRKEVIFYNTRQYLNSPGVKDYAKYSSLASDPFFTLVGELQEKYTDYFSKYNSFFNKILALGENDDLPMFLDFDDLDKIRRENEYMTDGETPYSIKFILYEASNEYKALFDEFQTLMKNAMKKRKIVKLEGGLGGLEDLLRQIENNGF